MGIKIGWLGFPTSRLDGAGRGIRLLKAVRQRIHNLAHDCNVLVGENLDTERREYCQEIS